MSNKKKTVAISHGDFTTVFFRSDSRDISQAVLMGLPVSSVCFVLRHSPRVPTKLSVIFGTRCAYGCRRVLEVRPSSLSALRVPKLPLPHRLELTPAIRRNDRKLVVFSVRHRGRIEYVVEIGLDENLARR